MCSPNEGFKLCSCGKKVKRKTFFNKLFCGKRNGEKVNEDLFKNTWHLYSRDNEIDIIGSLMLPHETESMANKLNDDYGFITQQLNTRDNCFDFDYSPTKDDLLVMYINGRKVSFVFDDEWYLKTPTSSGMSIWNHWLLNHGTIKN